MCNGIIGWKWKLQDYKFLLSIQNPNIPKNSVIYENVQRIKIFA